MDLASGKHGSVVAIDHSGHAQITHRGDVDEADVLVEGHTRQVMALILVLASELLEIALELIDSVGVAHVRIEIIGDDEGSSRTVCRPMLFHFPSILNHSIRVFLEPDAVVGGSVLLLRQASVANLRILLLQTVELETLSDLGGRHAHTGLIEEHVDGLAMAICHKVSSNQACHEEKSHQHDLHYQQTEMLNKTQSPSDRSCDADSSTHLAKRTPRDCNLTSKHLDTIPDIRVHDNHLVLQGIGHNHSGHQRQPCIQCMPP